MQGQWREKGRDRLEGWRKGGGQRDRKDNDNDSSPPQPPLSPSIFQGLKQSLTASGQWPQAWGALDAALRNKLQQLYQL